MSRRIYALGWNRARQGWLLKGALLWTVGVKWKEKTAQ